MPAKYLEISEIFLYYTMVNQSDAGEEALSRVVKNHKLLIISELRTRRGLERSRAALCRVIAHQMIACV